MTGFMDFFNGTASPEQRASLAGFASQFNNALGDGRRPVNFGAALAAGAQGMQHGREDYQDRQQAQEQMRQMMALRALQLRSAQGEADTADRQRGEQAAINAAAQGAVGADGAFDQAKFLGTVRSINALKSLDFERAMAKAGPEYDTTPQVVNGPNGPVLIQTSKTAPPRVLEGFTPREKLEFRDGGGQLYGLDGYSGEVKKMLGKTVSPEALLSAATQRRGQDMVDRRAVASNPGNKPLPAAALKMQQTELDALSTATGIDDQLARVQSQIEGGKLSFGPVSNLINRGLNSAGMSTETSRNLASFQSTLEKLRNDSLRLNAGVQTDGDAQRAWNELFQNINDTELVKQRLAEIRNINQRGAQLRKLNVDGIRANYGHEPLDTSQYERPSAPASKPAAGGGWSIQKVN